MAAEENTNSKIFALRAAQWVGCTGAHKVDGKWMPCETQEELERLSNTAEPQKKSSYEEMNKRYFKRRAKGKNKKKGWEKLNESRPLGGFATLEGGGIVSAPINSTIYSGGIKSYIPGLSPRDNDPDVFTDIESARKRSRMLGCIGVRRMPSATGKTIWMPCTNNSDYARVAGTTFLGRRGQQESQRRMVRTVIRQEMRNASKNNLRKKSLFEELSETKGLGQMIGRVTASSSATRRIRRAVQKIEGNLNPNERRDMDKDGLIFDGTWREMPAPSNSGAGAPAGPPPPPPPPPPPNKKRGSGLASTTNEIQDSNRPRWASPTNNNWFTPSKIKKGGNLKAQDLLDYDRLRLRKNRDEQATVLGVSRAVIDAMHEPGASIDPFDADRLIMSALNLHPALIFGESWLVADKAPLTETTGKSKSSRLGKLDERDNKILDMRANGQGVMDIANELGVSKQRASQLLKRALKRNEADLDSRGLSSSTSRGLSSSTSRAPIETYLEAYGEFSKVVERMPNPDDYLDVNDLGESLRRLDDARQEWRKNNPKLSSRYNKLLEFLDNVIDGIEENGVDSRSLADSEEIENIVKKVKSQRRLLTETEVHGVIAEKIIRRGLSSSTSNPMKRGDGMIKRDERGNPIREGDRRKESLESSIAKLKKLGMTDEEINLLMTGDRSTPVDAATPDVDITEAKRNPRAGLASQTGGLRSMSLSQMAKTSPSEWPESQKKHIVNWANSKPSFNVPYAIAQKFNRDGALTDTEWQRLLTFYTKYGPENRGGLRSSSVVSPSQDFSNVGAKRMAEIILARVRQDKRNKKPGTRTHFHVVGPGAVGKSTLREYLIKTGLIPPDSEAAHVDPDFIKQGIIGYNGGTGSEAVHRESARSATKTVDTAAKEGMDIVTEGTGYRLYEYKTTSDSSYKKVLHIPFLPFDKAEERLRKRNAQGGRQLPVGQIRLKGQQFYGWLSNHLNNGEVQDMYIWDMDVPEGAAPRVIAKIENGVFRAIDEPAFKKWSEQSGGTRGGDSNLAWFKRRYPEK